MCTADRSTMCHRADSVTQRPSTHCSPTTALLLACEEMNATAVHCLRCALLNKHMKSTSVCFSHARTDDALSRRADPTGTPPRRAWRWLPSSPREGTMRRDSQPGGMHRRWGARMHEVGRSRCELCCMVSNRHIAHMQQMIEFVKSTSAHVHASRVRRLRVCVQGKQSASLAEQE
jgi:hypothetical protein